MPDSLRFWLEQLRYFPGWSIPSRRRFY